MKFVDLGSPIYISKVMIVYIRCSSGISEM